MSMGRGAGDTFLGFFAAKVMWAIVKFAFRLLGRFTFGMPMDGKRRTNATFWCSGTSVVTNMPDWWGQRAPTRWAYLPGWQRAAIRLVCVGLLWEAWRHPHATAFIGINLATVVVGLAVWRVVTWAKNRRHNKERVRPLVTTLAQYLELTPDETKALVQLPPNFDTHRDAEVVITYPEGWDPHENRQKRIGELMARHIGTQWDVEWGRLEARWHHLPSPPALVEWEDLHPEGYPLSKVPIGVDSNGETVVFDMEGDSPHVLFTAQTGHGKSSTLRIPGTHTRVNSGLVDIIDFKLLSFTESLEGVSGVRVHQDMDSAVWCLSEFYVSMTAAYTAIKAKVLAPEDIPPRLLIIDEFDTFMNAAEDWWKAYCQREGIKPVGKPPFLQAWKFILWQGRAAQHRMVIGVHTPEAKIFGGTSAARNVFVNRLLQGPCTDTRWRQTFDSEPRVPFDPFHDGRGVANVGGGVTELQVAWLSEPKSRERAMAADPAPTWFDEGRLAPWVTQKILDRVAYDLRINWLSLDGTAPSEGTCLPAQTQGHVMASVHPLEDAAGAWLAAPYAARTRALEPLPVQTRTPETGQESGPVEASTAAPDEWIVGVPDAVTFLRENGFTEANENNVNRARFRARKQGNRWAGERRTDTGRPCWRPDDLLAHYRRKRAGRR